MEGVTAPFAQLAPPILQALDHAPRLVLRQERSALEAVTGLDTPNRYLVLDPATGAILGGAEEEAGGVAQLFRRWFLHAGRPFTMHVSGLDGGPAVLRLERPWRLFLSRVEVWDADGRLVGVVRQRFTWLRRRLDLEGPGGRTLARVVGPLLHPWTFVVEQGPEGAGREVGRIEKRWSGLGRELFTDADTYLLAFPPDAGALLRRLLLAAAILVDYSWFEQRGGGAHST